MKITELTNYICEFARQNLVQKSKSKMIQFVLGAATVGNGRKMIESKLQMFTSLLGDEEGNIDVIQLKESVCGGFSTSGSIPIFGGLISIDSTDAQEFFAYVDKMEKEKCIQQNELKTTVEQAQANATS